MCTPNHVSVDKLIPYDGVPTTEVDTPPNLLIGAIVLLAAMGIAFAVGCLTFNCIFRKKKSVIVE